MVAAGTGTLEPFHAEPDGQEQADIALGRRQTASPRGTGRGKGKGLI
jgi:hypothetical protein